MKHHVASVGLPRTFGRRVRELLIEPFAAPFPPSATDTRILMSDWSHFQGDIDIGKHLAYGSPEFQGVVIRTGQGKNSSYDDVKFVQNVQICEANDFPWMSYHVLLPNQDVPAQFSHMLGIIERLNGPRPKWVWWDVQLVNGQTKKRISNATIQAVNLTKPYLPCGVYSGKWFTDGYMETQDWFQDIEWWIAQWYHADVGKEYPWPNALPATVDISQVMIHQTTSHGDGHLVGIGSTRVDLDRWMWTPERFYEIMDIGNGNENGQPPEDLVEQVMRNTDDIAALRERQEILEIWARSYE